MFCLRLIYLAMDLFADGCLFRVLYGKEKSCSVGHLLQFLLLLLQIVPSSFVDSHHSSLLWSYLLYSLPSVCSVPVLRIGHPRLNPQSASKPHTPPWKRVLTFPSDIYQASVSLHIPPELTQSSTPPLHQSYRNIADVAPLLSSSPPQPHRPTLPPLRIVIVVSTMASSPSHP